MILGLQSRKEMKTDELKKEIKMTNLTIKTQQRRLNLWKAIKEDRGRLIFSIIESDVGIRETAKATYTINWMLEFGKTRKISGKKKPRIG